MMRIVIRPWLLMAVLTLSISLCVAQNNNMPAKQDVLFTKQAPKPFKILTNGKQVSIKSTKDISHIMVWTTSGHRIVEQKDINAGTFSFTITVAEKIFFLMVGLADGKIYTEKIGIQ